MCAVGPTCTPHTPLFSSNHWVIMTIWNLLWVVGCRRNERSKEGWCDRWQWGDPAGCLSSLMLLDVDLSLKGPSPGKALWHWQHVYTPGQYWSVSYAHTQHLSAEIIHFFLLVVMCLDCFNPVPQVCIHLLRLSPAVDWVSSVLLLLTVQQDGHCAPGVSLWSARCDGSCLEN